MEQVIELGNKPALKIHVQVVKKVDSVFKVGLPLAKWLYCICSDVIEWTSNCLLCMIPVKMIRVSRHWYSTEAWQRREWGSNLGPLYPNVHEGPNHKVRKNRSHYILLQSFVHWILEVKSFAFNVTFNVTYSPGNHCLPGTRSQKWFDAQFYSVEINKSLSLCFWTIYLVVR